jgi:transposase
MPRPCSADLRERVLLGCERGEGSQVGIARRFRVSERTVWGWLKRAREGRRTAKPMGRGPRPLGGERTVLVKLVAERNDATLAEYAGRLAERAGVRRSPSALGRAFRRLGLPRKKDAPRRRAGPVRYRRGARGVASRTGRGRAGPVGVPG